MRYLFLGLLCLFNPLLAKNKGEPRLDQIQSVSNNRIANTNTAITGGGEEEELTAQERFAAQNFVLVDYAEGVTTTEGFVTHWSNLKNFVVANNIRRLVAYVENPALNDFFNPSLQTGNQYYAYWVGQINDLGCLVEAFFDRALFTYSASSPVITPPDLPVDFIVAGGEPYSDISTDWLNLQDKMAWTATMISQHTPIYGVTIDPEGAGGDKQAQVLVNYMNYFRLVNNAIFSGGYTGLKLGCFFGFSSKNVSFSNLSNIPLPTDDPYTLISEPQFPPNIISTNWWGDFSPIDYNNQPILDTSYIEVYDPTIYYNFSNAGNWLQPNPDPAVAAKGILHLYRDEAYMPAYQSPGTSLDLFEISFEPVLFPANKTQVTGTATTPQAVNFIALNYPPFNHSNSLYSEANDTPPPNYVGSEAPLAYNPGSSTLNADTATEIGLIQSIPDSTTNQLYVPTLPGVGSATDVNYLVSEAALKWFFPAINTSNNAQIINNIYFVFSLEPNPIDAQTGLYYFGQWNLDTFMDFVTNFYNYGQTGPGGLPLYLPIYASAGNPPTAYVSLPNNFGIYDYRQIEANQAGYGEALGVPPPP